MLLGPGTGVLSWARGPSPFGRWGPPGWPSMWGRGKNRANPRIVLAWGRSNCNRGMGCNSSLSKTHNRTALSSSRGGSGSRGYNSGGGKRSSGGRARVGPNGRGRRGAVHLGSKVMSSARLHHGWAREGEKRIGRGEDGMKMKKWEGGGFK